MSRRKRMGSVILNEMKDLVLDSSHIAQNDITIDKFCPQRKERGASPNVLNRKKAILTLGLDPALLISLRIPHWERCRGKHTAFLRL